MYCDVTGPHLIIILFFYSQVKEYKAFIEFMNSVQQPGVVSWRQDSSRGVTYIQYKDRDRDYDVDMLKGSEAREKRVHDKQIYERQKSMKRLSRKHKRPVLVIKADIGEVFVCSCTMMIL